MWPLWAYMLTGVFCVFMVALTFVIGVWLAENHEQVFAAVAVATFLIVAGVVFGWMKYKDDLAKEARKPRPPAEAPLQ